MEEQDQEELEILQQWNMPERYKPLHIIGGGSYSTVCEALDAETKKSVAIKRIGNLFECLTDTKRILREIQLLRKMSHRFIVKLLDIFIDTKETPTNFTIFYLVLELCTSDLHKLTKLKFFLTEKQIKTICYNIAIGLRYLHACGVWHRDLKPGNILANDDCTIKITDFGLARSIGESMQPLPKESESSQELVKEQKKVATNSNNYKLTQHVVTRWYRAPELILVEKKYTDRIDI